QPHILSRLRTILTHPNTPSKSRQPVAARSEFHAGTTRIPRLFHSRPAEQGPFTRGNSLTTLSESEAGWGPRRFPRRHPPALARPSNRPARPHAHIYGTPTHTYARGRRK